MTRRERASVIANDYAAAEGEVWAIGLADAAIAILRNREEIAFKVLEECQTEFDETAIGPSADRSIWCVVCPDRAGFNLIRCRLAEELHLFEGLASPLAQAAGIYELDDPETTLETFAKAIGSP